MRKLLDNGKIDIFLLNFLIHIFIHINWSKGCRFYKHEKKYKTFFSSQKIRNLMKKATMNEYS